MKRWQHDQSKILTILPTNENIVPNKDPRRRRGRVSGVAAWGWRRAEASCTWIVSSSPLFARTLQIRERNPHFVCLLGHRTHKYTCDEN
uniref:Uncharacterized protein n=1 Tax=Oryza rufipogon TaxID=4529 RepID=A0A0E0PPP2_ORYRU